MSTRRRESPYTSERLYKNHYNINTFYKPPLGDFGIPVLSKCDYIPDYLHSYDERDKYKKGTVHFFCEDTEFESVWLRANRAPHIPPVVEKAGSALTPDFSLYRDWGFAVQLWQTYRTRYMGALWSSIGIQVVPTVSWARAESFQFCFEGLPVGGVLAVATCYTRDEEAQYWFRAGYKEMLKRCKPDVVLVYGQGFKEELEVLSPVVRYDSALTQAYKRKKDSPTPTNSHP